MPKRSLEEEMQLISEAGLEWSITARGRGFDSRYEITLLRYNDSHNHVHDFPGEGQMTLILANTKTEEHYQIGTFELKIIVKFLTESLQAAKSTFEDRSRRMDLSYGGMPELTQTLRRSQRGVRFGPR
jgi:hypothetical protein